MGNVEIFSVAEPYFKGNLHTHSTISDGRLAPEKVVELYRSMGYHFLALTEHEKFSWWQDLSCQDFLILPGIEIGAGAPGPYQCHHVVGIGAGKEVARHLEYYDNSGLTGLAGAQQIIAELNQAGYLTLYCHPDWSRQTFEEIKDLENFTALEIYNHGCQLEDRTGHAIYHWDSFLRRGMRVWGIATDDSHQHLADYGGGWVVVNAPSLTGDNILAALKEGRFYSSNGPEIKVFGKKNNEIYLSCSPAREIHFIAYERRGRTFVAPDGQFLEEAIHTLQGDEKYVRVEVVDEEGKIAWSNPIFL